MDREFNIQKYYRLLSRDYVMNYGVILLCIIVLYVFNIVISLVPVFNTIRKTPAQILARHDLE